MERQIKINTYELIKASCVPVDINEVTHVFYHTLVVDPRRAFANQDTNFQAAGNNQWMTTMDENEKPTCEYIQEDGTLVTGAYDVVPILDEFIKEHPDFDIEKERAEAKKVADAMKEEGWEFASHTWGHIKIGEVDLARLMLDTQKWHENVEPLVGKTDTIIFAHGQDLGKWGNYNETNVMYQYLREQGYRIFCNVDAGQYRTWFGKDYLRQGRRNLDGFRIYYNAIGKQDNVADLFDAAKIIDPLRPPVPPVE
ncbi:MAG: hypothetical protein HDR22_02005 [Lachnospiraceae bacterium]|nr:hypothetical protein [Lachnospiraceae bacterium]